jgi:WD40 repeat protein
MAKLLTFAFAALAAALAVLAWRSGTLVPRANTPFPRSEPSTARVAAAVGKPLYAPELRPPTEHAAPAAVPGDVVVIPGCLLSVVKKQEVPSQSEGVIRFIGTDAAEDPRRAEATPSRNGILTASAQTQSVRRLKEDDVVQAGQLLAHLDDQLSREDLEIKKRRVGVAKSELEASTRSAEEFRLRYETQLRLRQSGGATTEEDVRGAKLAWDRTVLESLGKRDALALAEHEVIQAEATLKMHEVRASMPGIVKAIYKRPGEAVKRLEPIVQIQDLSCLRAEGTVDLPTLARLAVGQHVRVEPFRSEAPRETYLGHFREVTSVAAGMDAADPVLVSASADGTVRIWDRKSGRERWSVHHSAPIRAVTCTEPGASKNLFLFGAADGVAKLGNVADPKSALRTLAGGHEGPVVSVAFSPDGRFCATGGEDYDVCVWNTADGSLRYRLPAIHRGAVTCLRFTRRAQLVTASRDNTLRLWSLGETGARLEATFDQRSGDVPRIDVEPHGDRILYDQGGVLRVLSLPDGRTESVLRSEVGNFHTFAAFSPSGKLVLTAAGPDARLRLWLVPISGRPREVCQLTAPDSTPTCATFTADGTSVVVGTREQQILVWAVPPEAELEWTIPAEVTRIDRAVGPGAKQVRIWAEFANPDCRLMPGTTATLVAYPEGR